MRVRINKSGDNKFTCGIDLIGVCERSQSFGSGSDKNDLAVFGRHRALFNDAQWPVVDRSYYL